MFKHAVTQALQTLLLTLLMTSPADANTKVKDGEGNIIDVSESNRIVSVGGAVTEIIYALGEEERLVGVDSTSLYPPVAQQLPSVGYIRTLPAEGILSLEPGMLIADGGAGPPEVIKQLESAGLPILQLADDPTLAGALNKIVVVGKALQREAAAKSLAEKIEQNIRTLQNALNGKQKKPRVLFLLSVSNGTPLAAGVDTSASSIIELAGGVNAVGGFTGYKPLSLEAAVAAEPEFILMMTHSARELGGAEQILALPQLRLTPAASDKRLIIMDGLLLLGFGARTDCAAYLLATKLHANENLPKPDQCQAT